MGLNTQTSALGTFLEPQSGLPWSTISFIIPSDMGFQLLVTVLCGPLRSLNLVSVEWVRATTTDSVDGFLTWVRSKPSPSVTATSVPSMQQRAMAMAASDNRARAF